MGETNRTAKLVRDLADEIICANGSAIADFLNSYERRSSFPNQVLHLTWAWVWRKIRTLRPETLGRIASYGGGRRIDGTGHLVEETLGQCGPTMYYCHCETWLGKYEDGLSLLRQIAATVICAEMAELLRDRTAQCVTQA